MTKSGNIKWHEVINKTLRQAKTDELENSNSYFAKNLSRL